MCFNGKLVAKMGSDFLLEVLMELPDDTGLHMVVVGVGTAGFVVHAKVVAVLRFALLAGRDYTLLPGRSHVDMR